LDEIKNHVSESDIWILVKGQVYNVTKYFDDHPGGGAAFLDVAG
jgi:cytochrome b involved in lipid metabolism